MSGYGWREAFYVCAAISFAWVALWALSFTEHPSEHRASRRPRSPRCRRPRQGRAGAVEGAVQRMLPVTIVYFCYGWTLWLFLSWIPQYSCTATTEPDQVGAVRLERVLRGVVGDHAWRRRHDRILARSASLRKARSWMVAVCML